MLYADGQSRAFEVLVLVIALLISSQLVAFADGLPAPTIDASLGVNIHQLDNPELELQMVRAAGLHIVRMDLSWDHVEYEPGKYDFSDYDKLIGEITRAGLRPLLILDYSNKLYEPLVNPLGSKSLKPAAPRTERSKAAFLNFVRAAVVKYEGASPIWEIWNEPDTNGFWPPQADADAYASLATAACQEIHHVAPAAAVLAPGVAKTPRMLTPEPPFLRSAIRSDLSRCITGVSVHPYLSLNTLDWAPQMWSDIRAMIAASPAAKDNPGLVPVSSEWGLSAYRAGISETTQASYIVKMLILDVSERIPLSIIYDWKDDGDDPKNPENRFGLLRKNGDAKPAYLAVKYITSVLAQASFQCRRAGDPTVLLFRKVDGTTVAVVWPKPGLLEWHATNNDAFDLAGMSAPKVAVDMLGKRAKVRSNGQGISIEGGSQPYFLTYAGTKEGIEFCR